ncbi:ATP-binding cassette domain-containing protein [Niveispirillum sp.]|uniref:ATP-binding cassette domain-containing protein n=1 Tax=Niveispirillum sp. TaxID=1917217 RepID=UPI001B64B7CD|nr:ATP-binding cassette domain-containing protein [Niveispirillum sp.]MBP7336875.1 ATP-binding cassette domain-containing protein [Niveispirillum sp.]
MIRHIIGQVAASGRLAELIAASVAINLLGLGSSLYSINVLNRYVSVGITATLVTLTAGALLAVLFEILLRRERQKVLDKLADGMERKVGQRVFDAFSRSAYASLSAVPLPVRREALGAPGPLQQLGNHSNLAAMLDAPFVVLYLLAIGLLHPLLGILVTVLCVGVLLMGWQGERRARVPAEAHAKAASRAQQLSQFLLAAGETLRGLPMLSPMSRRWRAVQDDAMGSRRSGMYMQNEQQTLVQSVGQVLSVLVYAVGAVAVVQGGMTTGALIGASILSSRAFSICSRVAQLADPNVRATRAEKALCEVEAVTQAVGGTVEPAHFAGKLELYDLAFSYAAQPVPLFERLSLELQPGQVLVISGPNGAGKSTLIKLMLGILTADRGMVRADDIELRQLSPAWWHRHAGYAPQEPVFFDGTLRENLLLDREVEEADLLRELRDIGLDGFLANDPQGLDRAITAHDTGLAIGLRRRFILVRALLGRPQVMFMDDPTEGLDTAGQAAVAKLLNRLVGEGRTLVIATNDAFIQRSADWLLDMSKKPTPALLRPATKAAEGAPNSAKVPHASE